MYHPFTLIHFIEALGFRPKAPMIKYKQFSLFVKGFVKQCLLTNKNLGLSNR